MSLKSAVAMFEILPQKLQLQHFLPHISLERTRHEVVTSARSTACLFIEAGTESLLLAASVQNKERITSNALLRFEYSIIKGRMNFNGLCCGNGC
jgi:hypothetical protein